MYKKEKKSMNMEIERGIEEILETGREEIMGYGMKRCKWGCVQKKAGRK